MKPALILSLLFSSFPAFAQQIHPNYAACNPRVDPEQKIAIAEDYYGIDNQGKLTLPHVPMNLPGRIITPRENADLASYSIRIGEAPGYVRDQNKDYVLKRKNGRAESVSITNSAMELKDGKWTQSPKQTTVTTFLHENNRCYVENIYDEVGKKKKLLYNRDFCRVVEKASERMGANEFAQCSAELKEVGLSLTNQAKRLQRGGFDVSELNGAGKGGNMVFDAISRCSTYAWMYPKNNPLKASEMTPYTGEDAGHDGSAH